MEKINDYPSYRRLSSLQSKLSRLGINIEFMFNVPYVYLYSVNGNHVNEKFMSDHRFTVALYKINGSVYELLDTRVLFKTIRKHL